jgi:5-hydroxyisourate hydrolase
MSTVSTHVLDTVSGEPASGVRVRLEWAGGELGRGVTDGDGRIADFGIAELPAGTYRLVFETGRYLARDGGEPFFPEVIVTFTADGRRPKYHVPLLLSPFSYSTYRGS